MQDEIFEQMIGPHISGPTERQKTQLSISGSGVLERGGFIPCSSRHASCVLRLSQHVLPLCSFISSDFLPHFLLNQLSAMLATRPSISSWCSTCQEIGSHQLQLMKQSRTYPLHHCTHDVATAISTVTLKRSAPLWLSTKQSHTHQPELHPPST